MTITDDMSTHETKHYRVVGKSAVRDSRRRGLWKVECKECGFKASMQTHQLKRSQRIQHTCNKVKCNPWLAMAWV